MGDDLTTRRRLSPKNVWFYFLCSDDDGPSSDHEPVQTHFCFLSLYARVRILTETLFVFRNLSDLVRCLFGSGPFFFLRRGGGAGGDLGKLVKV